MNESSNSLYLEKKKIRAYFYIGAIFIFIFLVGAVSFNYVRSLENEYSKKTDQLSAAIINDKKILMKNSVDQVIYLIETQKSTLRAQIVKLGTLSEKAFEAEFRAQIKPILRNLRLVNNGYVWINEITNYEGGDNYGFRFVHPNFPDTEGKPLSTNTFDTEGNQPYKIELEGIKKSGELYYEYSFKELGKEVVSHKMSYAKYYKPYNWIIATGVYLNDVDELVNSEKEKMHGTYVKELISSLIFSIFAIIIAIILLVLVEKQISRIIIDYENKINEYTGEIEEKTKKIQEDAEIKNKIFSILAHDLRSPIASSVTAIRYISKSYDTMNEATKRDLLSETGKSLDFQLELMDNLLSWSRLKNDTSGMALEKISVFDIIKNVDKLYSEILKEKNIKLEYFFDSEIKILGNTNMIFTIFRNIISNAIKFTSAGGSIKVTLENRDNRIHISFKDNGIGMSNERIEELESSEFSKTTMGTNGEKGTGFGLDLIKNFTIKNKGTFQIKSVEGVGTEILLVFQSI